MSKVQEMEAVIETISENWRLLLIYNIMNAS